MKRKTNEETIPLTIETPNIMSNIKLSKKLSRRIKEDDLFNQRGKVIRSSVQRGKIRIIIENVF